jgi:hypothetical protein
MATFTGGSLLAPVTQIIESLFTTCQVLTGIHRGPDLDVRAANTLLSRAATQQLLDVRLLTFERSMPLGRISRITTPGMDF